VPKKILVIDDSKTVLLRTRHALEQAGYVVVTLETAMGATSVIREERPDLILLDLTMPEVDGEQLLEVVRNFGILPDTTILLYSGEDEAILQLVTTRANADGYIQKTGDMDVLLTQVREYL